MKITDQGKTFTPAEAVAYVIEREVQRCDDWGRAPRVAALESMLGRLLNALVANGAVRANQLEEIFNYDVSVED